MKINSVTNFNRMDKEDLIDYIKTTEFQMRLLKDRINFLEIWEKRLESNRENNFTIDRKNTKSATKKATWFLKNKYKDEYIDLVAEFARKEFQEIEVKEILKTKEVK